MRTLENVGENVEPRFHFEKEKRNKKTRRRTLTRCCRFGCRVRGRGLHRQADRHAEEALPEPAKVGRTATRRHGRLGARRRRRAHHGQVARKSLTIPLKHLPSCNDIYWVLPSFDEFYWVLPSSDDVDWVLPSSDDMDWVLPSFDYVYWVLPSCNDIDWVLPRFTEF